MNGIIATENFRITGDGVDMPVTMELSESGAFAYGNRTCVHMRIGGNDEYFDTRYDTTLRRDGSNFRDWAKGFLLGYVRKGLTVD